MTAPDYSYPEAHYAGWQPEPEPRGRRRGLVIAGIVVGAVATIAVAAAVVAATTSWRPDADRLTGDVAHEQTVDAAALGAGVCLKELPDDGAVDTVTAVPCAQPHEAKVVSEYDFGAAVWPGQEKADARVARSCLLTDDERESSRTVTWAPTEEGWDDGDRLGLCLVVGTDPTGPL